MIYFNIANKILVNSEEVKKDKVVFDLVFFGGGEGNRTPVQKSFHTVFSECRHLLSLPKFKVKCQALNSGIPKVMIKAGENLYSRSPLIDALAQPRCSEVGRQPN